MNDYAVYLQEDRVVWIASKLGSYKSGKRCEPSTP